MDRSSPWLPLREETFPVQTKIKVNVNGRIPWWFSFACDNFLRTVVGISLAVGTGTISLVSLPSTLVASKKHKTGLLYLKDGSLPPSRISRSDVQNWHDWCSWAIRSRTLSRLPHSNTNPVVLKQNEKLKPNLNFSTCNSCAKVN